jgi:hypothetical protein
VFPPIAFCAVFADPLWRVTFVDMTTPSHTAADGEPASTRRARAHVTAATTNAASRRQAHPARTTDTVPATIDLSTDDVEDYDLGTLDVDREQHLTLDGPAATTLRDADPLARRLFAMLRRDCHADRLLVWQALAAALEGELDESARLALDACRLCCSDLAEADPGRDFTLDPLSEREYEKWHGADEQRKASWPSVSSVRRWLGGSWASVVEHLGQTPSPHLAARRASALLGKFTDDELRRQLKVCRAELSDDPSRPLDYVSVAEHRRWALQEMKNPNRTLARICLQPHPFRNAFGSWPAAVAASGGVTTAAGRRRATASRIAIDAYNADSCAAAVAYVAPLAGRAAMGWDEYDAKTKELRRDPDPPADLPDVLPSAQTIIKYLGSWPEALFAAGVIDAAERDVRLARVAVTLRDDELLATLAFALGAIGIDATKQTYIAYRKAMRKKHGPKVGLPSPETVYVRLGGWEPAKAAVLAKFPEVANATPTWKEA